MWIQKDQGGEGRYPEWDYFDAIDGVLGQWDYFDAIDAVLGHRPAVVIDTLKDITATEQGLGFDIPDTADPSSVTSGRT